MSKLCNVNCQQKILGTNSIIYENIRKNIPKPIPCIPPNCNPNPSTCEKSEKILMKINNEVDIPRDNLSEKYFNQGYIFRNSNLGLPSKYSPSSLLTKFFDKWNNLYINLTPLNNAPNITAFNKVEDALKWCFESKNCSVVTTSYDTFGNLNCLYFNLTYEEAKKKAEYKEGYSIYVKRNNEYNSNPSQHELNKLWTNTYSNIQLQPFLNNPGNPSKI